MRVEDKIRSGEKQIVIFLLILAMPAAFSLGVYKGYTDVKSLEMELALKDSNCKCCDTDHIYNNHKWIGANYDK